MCGVGEVSGGEFTVSASAAAADRLAARGTANLDGSCPSASNRSRNGRHWSLLLRGCARKRRLVAMPGGVIRRGVHAPSAWPAPGR